MPRIFVLAMISSLTCVLFGCVCRELPEEKPGPQPVPHPREAEVETLAAPRIDDAPLPDGFLPGWSATPGSYIYSASEDELWKIYDGSSPGIIAQGGREAVTQAYENREGGADKSFRVFILRFADQPRALAFLKKELEGAAGGEDLTGSLSTETTTAVSPPGGASAAPPGTGRLAPATVDAGQIFDKGKAPWARFVVGPFLISINWEGSSDDSDNASIGAIGAIAWKVGARCG